MFVAAPAVERGGLDDGDILACVAPGAAVNKSPLLRWWLRRQEQSDGDTEGSEKQQSEDKYLCAPAPWARYGCNDRTEHPKDE